MVFHLDTDFAVFALSRAGPERKWLLDVAESDRSIEMSAVAWYEFARGPRRSEQLAVAREFLGATGIVPLTDEIATAAAEVFRKLGSPRRRNADIAIGVTALLADATLVTRNADDYSDIHGLTVLNAEEDLL